MTFDLPRILTSKLSFRRELATRDIGEKLRLLDALGERARELRAVRLAGRQGSESVTESVTVPNVPSLP